MTLLSFPFLFTILIVLGTTSCTKKTVCVDDVYVAVASNFTEPVKAIKEAFEKETGYRIKLAFGSTGKHYAQIKNGAPFDVFLGADVRRPKLLEEEGHALPGSRFTYAHGKLALWSPDKNLIDDMAKVLSLDEYRHIALANPKLAPYGSAAQEILEKRNLWGNVRGKVVLGENIAQTYQFIASGNAQLGFVALSQIQRPGKTISGSYIIIDPTLHKPIAQQAVLLKNNKVACAFMAFLQGEKALQIISGFGYDRPEDTK